ncbi:MAG: DUF3768 domain-containing protein [Caulobacter sp.]|nr:DUF3768 domain-containing protein [Caulobacter sp.]
MTSFLHAERIRQLNDDFREGGSGSAGEWFLTRGVQSEGADFVIMAIDAVRNYFGFDPHNDPYQEHDFGSVNVAGQHLFWKIDYYDPSLCYGSEDPADPTVTRRVLTVMLASEY